MSIKFISINQLNSYINKSVFWLFMWESHIHNLFVFFWNNEKKYSLMGLLWLLIVGLWIWWWWNKSNYWTYTWTMFTKQSTSLLSYLPDSVDQVMHVKITPETEQFLVQTNEWIDPTEFPQRIENDWRSCSSPSTTMNW